MINLFLGIKRFFTRPNSSLQAQLAKCESPMEATFVKAAWPVLAGRWRLVTQYPLDGYRIDVALPELRIAVEIDGHDYHSSKKQMAADMARQRDLTRRGWTVIRFTGSEVYADAAACAREVEAIIISRSGR